MQGKMLIATAVFGVVCVGVARPYVSSSVYTAKIDSTRLPNFEL